MLGSERGEEIAGDVQDRVDVRGFFELLVPGAACGAESLGRLDGGIHGASPCAFSFA